MIETQGGDPLVSSCTDIFKPCESDIFHKAKGGSQTAYHFSTKSIRKDHLLRKVAWNLVLLNLGLIASFVFVQHAMFYTFPPDPGRFIWVGREVYLVGSLAFLAFVKTVNIIVKKA